MRVLMIVQLVDEREWLRGFTVDWIRALAARVERVEVLTLEQGQADLPDNVTVQSMGKERSRSRLREALAFYRAIGRVIRDVDVIFSHMTPRYTWMAAPYAKLYGKPQMLWFTHRQNSAEIRMALAAARWVTTATRSSFAIDSPKVHAMGHGIDTHRFSPGDSPPDDPPLVLSVARLSPIKNHHVLLDAAALLRDKYGDPPVRFGVAGTMIRPGDGDYYQSLLRQRDDLGLDDERFAFMGALPPTELALLYRRASLTVNLTPAGSFDKAVLEAMLTETPPIIAIPAFDDLLGDHRDALRVPDPEDADAIAAQIAALLHRTPAERAAMGADLRVRAAAHHSLDDLMGRIVALMENHTHA
ncbi:MAG: glycosyltransferase family 4 protein [Anaerolineae bacterium]|nr:glycosyltransferase family 4 protein [Anaerolineae bacterium]